MGFPRVVLNLSGGALFGKSRALKFFIKKMRERHSGVTICTVGTGDEFRRAKETNDLSLEEIQLMARGSMLSDTRTGSLVKKALVRERAFAQDGIILDVYPRVASQLDGYKALVREVSGSKTPLNVMITLTVSSEDVIKKRFEQRQALENRPDDVSWDTVKDRLDLYRTNQPPLEAAWRAFGGQIIYVDAERSADEVDADFYSQASRLFI